MRCPAPRSLCATLLLSVHLIGCTEWHVAQASPQALLDGQRPARVRVTLLDDMMQDTARPPLPNHNSLGGHPGPSAPSSGLGRGEIVLDRPSIIGDSLVGQMRGRSSGVAVADIASVSTLRTSPVKTLLLVGGVGLIIAGGVALLTSLGNFGDLGHGY